MKPRVPGRRTSMLPLGLPQNPMEYLDILVMRWPWVVVPLLLGVCLSEVAMRYAETQYRSSTLIIVESEKIPRDFIPQLTTSEVRDRLQTVQQEILARPRIERILEELDPYPVRGSATQADLIELIRKRTNVGLRGRDAFIIEYTDNNPERAQQLAGRLASLFIEETSGAREKQVEGANVFIERRLDEAKAQLEEVEASLRALKRRYMGMLPEQLNANLGTLQRLQMEQQSVREAVRAAKDRKALLERQHSIQLEMMDPESRLLPSSPTGDARPSNVKHGELDQLEAELMELRKRYTDEHPDVETLRSRIDSIRQANKVETPEPDGEGPASSDAPLSLILAELETQVAAAEHDVEKLETREAEIEKGIQEYQHRVEMVPKVEQELRALERDYAMIDRYYTELLSTKLQAETAGAVERQWKEEQFRILEPAQLPEVPIYPKRSTFLSLGFLIGLGAGLGLALLVELLDHSIKDVTQLEALVPYPLLLTLPHIPAGVPRWKRLFHFRKTSTLASRE